jgi:type II secretory pathway component PulF
MAGIATPRKLSRRAGFFHQLAQLLSSGLTATQALTHLRSHPPDPVFAGRADAIIGSIERGAGLTEAIRGSGDWLPAFDLALLEAGERSGRVPDACLLLSRHYQEQAALIRTQMAVLAYPVFLFHVAFLIFPVERFVALVWKGDVWGYFVQKLLFFGPIYVAILLLLLMFRGSGKERWRWILERLLHSVPVLGAARRSLAISRLSAALGALLSAGLGMVEAWLLAARASGSVVLAKTVTKAAPRLATGETPAEMVENSREFPDHFASLYRTGEISGRLDDALLRLSHYYSDEGSRKLKIFMAVASGTVIGVVMLAVAWQIISFYLGLFQQVNNL